MERSLKREVRFAKLWQRRWRWAAATAVLLPALALAWSAGTWFLGAMDKPFWSGHASRMVLVGVVVGAAMAVGSVVTASYVRWSRRRLGRRRRLAAAWCLVGAVWAASCGVTVVLAGPGAPVLSVDVVVITALALVWAGLVPMMDGVVRAEAWWCASCGYERPGERTAVNGRCPECGNGWWVDAFEAGGRSRGGGWFGPAVGAVRGPKGCDARRAVRRGAFASNVVSFLPTVYIVVMVALPIFASSLPTPVLRLVVERTTWNGLLASAGYKELFGQGRGLSDEDRGALVDRIVDRRRLGWEVPLFAAIAVDDAIVRGAVSREAARRYASGLMEVAARVVEEPGGGFEVFLEAELIGVAEWNGRGLVVAVRVDGEPLEGFESSAGGGGLGFVRMLARAWEHRGAPGGAVGETSESARASMARRAAAQGMPAPADTSWSVRLPESAAGREVEVDVWLEYIPSSRRSVSHDYFDADGVFVPPSEPVWGELRTVRARVPGAVGGGSGSGGGGDGGGG